LYEAITGEVPFNADTFNELLFKIVLEAARPVEQIVPGLDPSFAAIVNKSMAREPAARFQTAREFQSALEQWGSGAGPQLAAALNASAPAGQQHQQPGPHAPMGTGQYAAAPAHTLGTGTPGSWANTGAYGSAEAIPKKSNAGLFVGLALVGALVLGGGAFAAMSLSQGKDEAAAALGKAEAEKLEAEKAQAEQAEREKAAREATEKARAEAEQARAEVADMRTEADKAKAAAAAAAAEAAEKAKVAAAPAPRAKPVAAAPKPEPKSEPKPAATPATTSTGRRIRTSL
jgi:serine/threonine-protein kinase